MHLIAFQQVPIDPNASEQVRKPRKTHEHFEKPSSKKFATTFLPKTSNGRKIRDGRSDLDDFLTESIAAMKTIISKKFVGSFGGKTQKKLAKTSRKLRERGDERKLPRDVRSSRPARCQLQFWNNRTEASMMLSKVTLILMLTLSLISTDC